MARVEQEKAELQDDIKKHKKTNRELTAKSNGMHIVPASDPKEPKKRGRPPGQTATKNKRPTRIDMKETIDVEECPKCKGHELSENVTDSYDRVVEKMVTIPINILYKIQRRYCRNCKTQVSAPIPDVAPYARSSKNKSAAAVMLNLSGLSHGKIAEFFSDMLGSKMSTSWSYRNKCSVAKRMEPTYDDIRRNIQDEPYLQCDEFRWPVPNDEKPGLKNGYAIVTQGKDYCVVELTSSRSIEEYTAQFYWCSGAGFVYGMTTHWWAPPDVHNT